MKHGKTPEGRLEELKSELSEAERVVVGLRAELDAEKARSQEYLDMGQRLKADFENHVRRGDADRRELVKTASRELVLKLVDVLDTMDLALKAAGGPGAHEKVLSGFRMVASQLRSALSSEGLCEVRSDVPFDPAVHEAVEAVGDCSKPDGTIIEVVQKGYTLNGRLIRAAKVAVVKNRGDLNG
jgi:molecular chaperone GrpE